MPEEFQTTIRRTPSCTVVYTDGYIDKAGGEKIAGQCLGLLEQGEKRLILNLAKSTTVNSLGIASLIEVIEKVRAEGEKIVFCCCTYQVAKTFEIMGLTQFAQIHDDEKAALEAVIF